MLATTVAVRRAGSNVVEHEQMVARVRTAVEQLGGESDAGEFADLLAVQDAPPRRYHTTTHLAEMWAEVDRLDALLGGDGVPWVVDLAIAFHDVVYDPTSDDNERRSARRAERVLTRQDVRRHAVEEVERLVHVTIDHHAEASDLHAALVADADLWVLSAPHDRYDRYAADVRAEYGHVGDAAWRAGRTRVLDHLDRRLAAGGYLVGPAQDRAARTARARTNLARERAGLGTT